MKCPNCKSKMEEGSMRENSWFSNDELAGDWAPEVIGGTRVYTYLCPKCGRVEHSTKKVDE